MIDDRMEELLDNALQWNKQLLEKAMLYGPQMRGYKLWLRTRWFYVELEVKGRRR